MYLLSAPWPPASAHAESALRNGRRFASHATSDFVRFESRPSTQLSPPPTSVTLTGSGWPGVARCFSARHGRSSTTNG